METQYALAVLNGGQLAKLDEIDRLFMSEGGNTSLAYEFKPTRLKMSPGGGKSFQDAEGNTVPAPLVGYVIDAVKTRAYWPTKQEDGGNPIPFCSSMGAVTGFVNPHYLPVDLLGAAGAAYPHPALMQIDRGLQLSANGYDCASCPMARFGSVHQGGEGAGQACKSKVLFMFLPQGWFQPCLLSVPATSIKAWSSYASNLKQKTGREFYAFKTKIEVEQVRNKANIAYGQMKFVNDGPIESIETAQAVLTLRRELRSYLYDRDVAIMSDDEVIEASGRVVDPATGEVLEGAPV